MVTVRHRLNVDIKFMTRSAFDLGTIGLRDRRSRPIIVPSVGNPSVPESSLINRRSINAILLHFRHYSRTRQADSKHVTPLSRCHSQLKGSHG